MNLDRQTIEQDIKSKIVEIVDRLDEDARGLLMDEVIPASGLIDSVGLLELLAWYEDFYRIPLPQEEITIDNLGTIAAMATYVLRRKGLL